MGFASWGAAGGENLTIYASISKGFDLLLHR